MTGVGLKRRGDKCENFQITVTPAKAGDQKLLRPGLNHFESHVAGAGK